MIRFELAYLDIDIGEVEEEILLYKKLKSR